MEGRQREEELGERLDDRAQDTVDLLDPDIEPAGKKRHAARDLPVGVRERHVAAIHECADDGVVAESSCRHGFGEGPLQEHPPEPRRVLDLQQRRVAPDAVGDHLRIRRFAARSDDEPGDRVRGPEVAIARHGICVRDDVHHLAGRRDALIGDPSPGKQPIEALAGGDSPVGVPEPISCSRERHGGGAFGDVFVFGTGSSPEAKGVQPQ